MRSVADDWEAYQRVEQPIENDAPHAHEMAYTAEQLGILKAMVEDLIDRCTGLDPFQACALMAIRRILQHSTSPDEFRLTWMKEAEALQRTRPRLHHDSYEARLCKAMYCDYENVVLYLDGIAGVVTRWRMMIGDRRDEGKTRGCEEMERQNA